MCVCEDKFEFETQRRKPTKLAAPLLASDKVNLPINRALLTVLLENFQAKNLYIFSKTIFYVADYIKRP